MKRTGFDHPKIGRLQNLLELPRFAAVGLLESIWLFTGNHAPAGDVGKWTDQEIATAVGWPRDPAIMINALVEARLLDRDPTARLLVHDWFEHCDDGIHQKLAREVRLFANGDLPKMTRLPKEERTQLLEKYRLKENHGKRRKATESDGKRSKTPALPSLAKPSLAKPCLGLHSCSEPPSTAAAEPCEGGMPLDAPEPPNDANPQESLAGPEGAGLAQAQEGPCSAHPGPLDPGGPNARPLADVPTAPRPVPCPVEIVMEFPCVGAGPDRWPLTVPKLAEYVESYPGIDPLAEARAARQWCIDNPQKRKTARGMPKFLNDWMARAQNAGGSPSVRASRRGISAVPQLPESENGNGVPRL